MVNFGGHVTSVLGESHASHLVPYNECKRAIYESSEKFEKMWTQALKDASDDFSKNLGAIWKRIFHQFDPSDDNLRGIPLGDALRLFAEKADRENVQQTINLLSALHTSIVTNSEGLRKLIKKHDKKTEDLARHLTVKLLPSLYSSPFYIAEATLTDSISTLRSCVDVDDSEGFNPLKKFDSELAHQKLLESRFAELEWLNRLAKSIPHEIMSAIVAHRGFHNIDDRNDKRPIENSTSSFETAWSSGIYLCECDIALTKDEKLVLAHDESFKRLALDSNAPIAGMRVSDLTFRELMSLPLKSGVRPPLLIDVLRSAKAIADWAQLIIEIKPGNPEVGSALARLLIRHPELCPCVAMVMSFDAICMHRLREELSAEFTRGGVISPAPSRLSLTGNSNLHRRLSSFDHFGAVGLAPLGRGSSFRGEESTGNLGLSLSQTNLAMSPPSPNFPPRLSMISNRSLSIDEKAVMQTLDPLSGETTITMNSPSATKMPELLLLTVCDEPQHPCELRMDISDFSPLESWLAGVNNTGLDGVYLQYQPEMKTEEGARALKKLSGQHKIGVWMYADKDPDDYETVEWLVRECGVSYVNTDLPRNFRQGVSPKGAVTFDD